MDITGKIIAALPEQSGISRAGNPWKKKEYVLETLDTYPKKVAFTFFGDRCDQYPLSVNQTVKIDFDLESREFNGRWYTDVRAWKAEQATVAAAPAAAPAPAAPTQGSPLPPPPVVSEPGAPDDLPF